MTHLLSLHLADGNELDIAGYTITWIESLDGIKNEKFPDANCFIRYTYGTVDQQALITERFDAMQIALNIDNSSDRWMMLNRSTKERIAFRKSNVVARRSLSDDEDGANCEVMIAVNNGGDVGAFKVIETREEVRNIMEGLAPSPAPVSIGTYNGKTRKSRAKK